MQAPSQGRCIDDVWIGLSVAAAALVTCASAGGVLLRSTYARETTLWAAQGAGQDVVNLVIAVPVLLWSARLARRGSVRAALVWFGVLLYVVYSYLLYAFFVHFNGLFLIYVAALGVSVFALAGAAARWPIGESSVSAAARGERALAGWFMAIAVLFGALWLSEIVPALAAGVMPPSATEAGLIVNPVHVLDLAFVLPALAVTAVLLWRRHPVGFLAAVPLATFTTIMSLAIIGMSVAVRVRGLGSTDVAAPMVVLAAVTVVLAQRVVRSALRHS